MITYQPEKLKDIMLCTIKDFKKVHRILVHESVYPFITDDYSSKEPTEDLGLSFLENSVIKVLMPNDNCVFILVPMSTNVYTVHSNVLPEGRGKVAVLAAKSVAKWMFNNTECVSIISFTPEYNKVALIFSRLAGMKRIGVLKKSFKKDNIFYDQIITSLNKGDI